MKNFHQIIKKLILIEVPLFVFILCVLTPLFGITQLTLVYQIGGIELVDNQGQGTIASLTSFPIKSTSGCFEVVTGIETYVPLSKGLFSSSCPNSPNPITPVLINTDANNLLNIEVYPNPAMNSCTVKAIKKTTENSPYQINLINNAGKIVYTQRNSLSIELTNGVKLNLMGQAAGVYFVELVSNHEHWVKKIIISNSSF